MDYGIQPQAGLREVETFRLPADADGGCWKEPGVFTAGSVAAMFLAPAFAFAESGPVSPPGLFRHLQYICSGIDNSYNCAKAVEADRFRKGIAGVSRNGRDLVIKVGASQATVFQDVGRGESTRGARYSYVDYFPSIRSHVVYVQYYEGGDFLLVDKDSGRKVPIWSIPIPSPDSSRFMTATAAIAYGSNGLQVWRMTPEGPVLEWSHEATGWGPGAVQWLDGSTIAVSTDGLADEVTLPADFPKSIGISFRNKLWVIEGLPR